MDLLAYVVCIAAIGQFGASVPQHRSLGNKIESDALYEKNDISKGALVVLLATYTLFRLCKLRM